MNLKKKPPFDSGYRFYSRASHSPNLLPPGTTTARHDNIEDSLTNNKRGAFDGGLSFLRRAAGRAGAPLPLSAVRTVQRSPARAGASGVVGSGDASIVQAVEDAVGTRLDSALSALSPVDRKTRDALAARVDAILSNIDAEAVNQGLETRLPMEARM